MPQKKWKRKELAFEFDDDVAAAENIRTLQLEIGKRLFIRALQSKPVSVFVGDSQRALYVPEELLVRYSPAFKRMLQGYFKESIERSIELPEDSISVFGDFLVWVYGQTPSISAHASLESLVGLAVFADKYMVHLLKNQISDVMRKGLSENKWNLTPEIMCVVYEGTPVDSILRRLCSWSFAMNMRETDDDWGELNPRKDDKLWKPVFTEFADFGWDYFQISLSMDKMCNTPTAAYGAWSIRHTPILGEGACLFHDHSDISAWKRDAVVKDCPYPQGAPLELPDDDDELAKALPEPPAEEGTASGEKKSSLFMRSWDRDIEPQEGPASETTAEVAEEPPEAFETPTEAVETTAEAAEEPLQAFEMPTEAVETTAEVAEQPLQAFEEQPYE